MATSSWWEQNAPDPTTLEALARGGTRLPTTEPTSSPYQPPELRTGGPDSLFADTRQEGNYLVSYRNGQPHIRTLYTPGPDGQMQFGTMEQYVNGAWGPMGQLFGQGANVTPGQPGVGGTSLTYEGSMAGQGGNVNPPPPPVGQTQAGTNYQQVFNSLTGGLPPTPDQLVALESQLSPYGIKVLKNAAGVAGKIQLPSGQIVDVIGGAMQGGRNWQWLTTGDDAGTTQPGAPYAGVFTGGGQYPLASVMGEGFMRPWTVPFQAPNDVTQQNDPGWQFRMREGLNAIEKSAAAKGTLLSGGTLKALNSWAQDYASNEYDKVYGRALGEYQQAMGIYGNNAATQWGRLGNLANYGLSAAGGLNQAGGMYAANAGDIYGQMGNAQGAGAALTGNAYAQMIYGGGGLLSDLLRRYGS